MRKRAWMLALLGASAHATNATSRLVFGSCSKHFLPQPLWAAVRARNPRAWIWAGDAIYGDRMVRAVPLTFEALGPEYLREAYAAQNALPEYAQLRTKVPHFIATWDDHDFGLNDGSGDLPWRAASQEEFLAAMDLTVPRGQAGVYSATTVSVAGGAVLVVALDLRYHKSPYSSSDGDFLGEAQWAWLAETLDSATADAVVVVSSLQVLDERYGLGERWGRFPGARDRLLNVLEACPRPLLIISGDVHMAELATARCGRRTLVDFTSSGMTHAWSYQVRAGFSKAFAHVLTAAMASFQALAPLEWQAVDARGRRMHFLDLNFGELDFDMANGMVTARVFGTEAEPVLERAFRLQELGVGGKCRPLMGFLPLWRHAIALALWCFCMCCVVLAPVVIAVLVAWYCLGRPAQAAVTLQDFTMEVILGTNAQNGIFGKSQLEMTLTASSKELLTKARAARFRVFCTEQGVPVGVEQDAYDTARATIHVLAALADHPIGAARVVIDPQKRLGMIGRVCVLKAHRRRCVGRRVVLRAVDALRRSHPGYTATLGSQVEAVGFYESMGFRLIPGEEPFVDGPGCLHRTMVM